MQQNDLVSCPPTFIIEYGLLRRRLIIDTAELERVDLILVLDVRDAHDVRVLRRLDSINAGCRNDAVTLRSRILQGSNASDNPDTAHSSDRYPLPKLIGSGRVVRMTTTVLLTIFLSESSATEIGLYSREVGSEN